MWSYSKQKALQESLLGKAHESVDVMKNCCTGCLECQNVVVNRKNSCLSCFICAQWNQSFSLKAINWGA